MSQTQSRPGLHILEVLAAWKSILTGSAPMMSIEVTRECPLSCPGCYAYGEMHLGGSVNLRSLSDYRGKELVDGIVRLVQQHRPLHLSLVGGAPLVRHRELSRVLPILSSMKVHTMVVTSASKTFTASAVGRTNNLIFRRLALRRTSCINGNRPYAPLPMTS